MDMEEPGYFPDRQHAVQSLILHIFSGLLVD
jgi:hypothetical protein